ncbi:hypothetical protein N658DRAFT_508803 [Parathielavia hyrcaniae]|uniref:Gamma interferon inducible lysosomal thiol reductase n=1 Tax=Parathielavia hyrcaniae TaxID=113614 RepID=A0AAN6PWP6_9PEZI|nr:hypothetical protein N658DRAFT_508803 [Parathielavia hyrcaniae]
MDEKHAPMPPPIRRGFSPLRLVVAVCWLALAAFVYCHFTVGPRLFLPTAPSAPSYQQVATAPELVPLEAHIMSKCPDAKDCLRDMVLPAMQKVHDKVNFTLSFIGTPTDRDDGVECRHGPAECLGNIIELCAQRLYPDPKTFLGFAMCLTRDYFHIPQRSLIEDCALEHAIDFDKLNDCATKDDGAFGVGMLRDSVRRTTKLHRPPQ